MKIAGGFGGEPLEIKVSASDGKAEIWTDMRIYAHRVIRQEYLHYATITELIALRDELNGAIKELAGI